MQITDPLQFMQSGGALFHQGPGALGTIVIDIQLRPIVTKIIHTARPGPALSVGTLGGQGFAAVRMNQFVAVQRTGGRKGAVIIRLAEPQHITCGVWSCRRSGT